MTLTGTAPAGSTVTVSDGGTTALGTATANSTTGAWTYTTAALSAGSYAFTATDTTSAGTSAASSAFDVTVTSSSPPPSGPTVSSIVNSPASGDLDAGKTVTLTLKMSDNVTVNTTHGTPTLTLNDGGTATYTSGSGSNALTFSYTVGAGDKNVTSLAATTINLNGATIQDGSGNAANLSLTGLTQTGPQIDTSTPTVSSIAKSPSSGDLNAGKTVTYSIALSETVTVSGTPQLMLNDGGTASYASGTGTSTLTFVYTVAAGQNTPDLMVTGVNLNGGSITDGAGNAANLSLTGVAQGSPAIDTTPPTVSSVLESPASGNLNAGNKVTLTLDMSENVTVNTAHGTPTLTLNDGGTATYTGGSGTSALTFSYTVVNGQNTASPGGDGDQSQRCYTSGWCRQRRQPVADRPDPDRPADRHLGGSPWTGRSLCRAWHHPGDQPGCGNDRSWRHCCDYRSRFRIGNFQRLHRNVETRQLFDIHRQDF